MKPFLILNLLIIFFNFNIELYVYSFIILIKYILLLLYYFIEFSNFYNSSDNLWNFNEYI